MAESYPHGFVAVTECSSIVGDCMQLVFQLPWVWFILYDSPPVDFFVIYESDLYGLYFFFFFPRILWFVLKQLLSRDFDCSLVLINLVFYSFTHTRKTMSTVCQQVNPIRLKAFPLLRYAYSIKMQNR